jgi:urease accessory protein
MSALPSQLPAPRWRARLELQFERRDARTRLTHRVHHGPLLVQRAFYPEGPADCAAATAEPCHVYIIHPPGGVVSGDELSLEAHIRSQAHALLTTPAAGKFYRQRDVSVASLTQTLRVDDGTLEWLPQENIYYPDAVVELRTVARLRGSAKFIGWEIGCLGLPANSRSLSDGRVRQCFELWCDEAPVLLERVSIDRSCLAARWGLAGRVALATMLAYPAHARHLETARAAAAVCAAKYPQLQLACTLVDKTLCCRGYAARADRLKQAFIDIWSALRPELLGRRPTAPRIWMT